MPMKVDKMPKYFHFVFESHTVNLTGRQDLLISLQDDSLLCLLHVDTNIIKGPGCNESPPTPTYNMTMTERSRVHQAGPRSDRLTTVTLKKKGEL